MNRSLSIAATAALVASTLLPSSPAHAEPYANGGIGFTSGSAASLGGVGLVLDAEFRNERGAEFRGELTRWGRHDEVHDLWAPATTGEVSMLLPIQLGRQSKLAPFIAVETLTVPVYEQRCNPDGCRWNTTLEGHDSVHAFAGAFGLTYQRTHGFIDGKGMELSLGLQTEDSWGATVLVPRGELAWRTRNNWEWSIYGSYFDGGIRLGKRFGTRRDLTRPESDQDHG